LLASVYALVVGLIYRSLTLRAFWSALYETLIMTTGIMFVIAFATAMGWLYAFEQIPQKLAGSR
jgi:TRAP-type C4-dicarboxylate transport system permease large subunit